MNAYDVRRPLPVSTCDNLTRNSLNLDLWLVGCSTTSDQLWPTLDFLMLPDHRVDPTPSRACSHAHTRWGGHSRSLCVIIMPWTLWPLTCHLWYVRPHLAILTTWPSKYIVINIINTWQLHWPSSHTQARYHAQIIRRGYCRRLSVMFRLDLVICLGPIILSPDWSARGQSDRTYHNSQTYVDKVPVGFWSIQTGNILPIR